MNGHQHSQNDDFRKARVRIRDLDVEVPEEILNNLIKKLHRKRNSRFRKLVRQVCKITRGFIPDGVWHLLNPKEKS
ncbi:hypothetical protein CEE37_09900 [candidate division LCP-89 bacterium B3_LCP]|uniref:Uncharacterized protein n=1 Tax=candidate division LCP-89 bacterium B3_LCP TaxID=2012998 RepID=A0A532UYM3_UNCL8|nr:MAG: hypothetical protein CEE37_09900 [candidate division LCP-89 bacterium B3_LCP]